ncbi:MAG: BatA domain-containing protein [Planctomycetota bacterium]
MTLLALSFVNSALLGFTALAAIPLIIHLINRQRYQRVPWAAMEFLLAAMRKNRRRMQMENLLLLLLRILAVLLFVLGMARPLLDSAVPVGNTSSLSELYVVDRSYSMGYRDGSRSVLFRAREDIKRRVKALGSRDRVGLIFGGGFPEVMYNDAQFCTDEKREELLERVEELDLLYEPLEVAATLQRAAEWVEQQQARGGEGGWQIHLYTDLQRKDWLAGDPDADLDAAGGAGMAPNDVRARLYPDTSVSTALDRVAAVGAHLVLHPIGATKPRNATVTDLSCTKPLLSVDLPTSFQVTVQNHSSDDLAGIEVELTIDGQVQGSRQISLGPGETKKPSFPYVFREAGWVRVTARIRTDGLEEDNVIHGVYQVRKSVSVVVADGTAGREESEGSWIEAVLLAYGSGSGRVRLTPYDAYVIASRHMTSALLDSADVLVLTNVPALSQVQTQMIEEFLEDGGGVLAFVGDQLDPASYSRNAYREGQGWFPFDPANHRRDKEQQLVFNWRITNPDHPTLSYLASDPAAGLGDVAVYGFVPTRTEIPSESVLMELNTQPPTPALIENRFGNGSVLVMNMGAGRADSDFPVSPSYLVFLHETLPYLCAGNTVPHNLSINEPFSLVIPSERYSPRVFLIRPDSTGFGVPLDERPDKKSFGLEVAGQKQPGLYEIRFGEGAGETGEGADAEWFAVNGDPDEGVLAPVSQNELEDVYSDVKLFWAGTEVLDDEASVPPTSSGELWRAIFWAVLALLIGESALARFFGRSRVK